MEKELLKKFFYNQCSADEIREILDWFDEKTQNFSDRNLVYQLWADFSPELRDDQDRRYDRMLDRVHHLINLSGAERPNVRRSPSEKRLFHSVMIVLTRAAAILFIPLVILLIYNYRTTKSEISVQAQKVPDFIEIVSPVGSRTFIQLSDGTGVHLNHGSSLKYPREFRESKRMVELTGEAYFSVVTNPSKPFVVKTGNLNITALGTEFNVMAYKNEKFIETTLVQGEVVVMKQNSDGSLQEICEMKPDQHLKVSLRNNTFKCETVDPSRYVSWKDGVLVFKNEALEEITSRLGRWYNVEFIFRNESVKEFTYTATFVDETLTQILDLLSLATPIKYEMTSRIKLQDGTFSKPKVFIDVKRN
jgi:transmembrane sensor